MNRQIFVYTENLPDKEQFEELFLTTGWNNSYQLSADDLMKAVENSWYCYSAYDANQLVGFGRVICDGVVHALIIDLIVHPDYQQLGLGKKILNQLVTKCKEHRVRDIQLFSAKNKAAFYKKCGFTMRPDISPGMEMKWFNSN